MVSFKEYDFDGFIVGGSNGDMGKRIIRLLREGFASDSSAKPVYGVDLVNSDLAYEDLECLYNDIGRFDGFVYIDFTTPKAVIDNVKFASSHGADCIIGTTGWYNQISDVRDMANAYKSAIVYASNFSKSMIAFTKASEIIAKILGYDALIFEAHHDRKEDAPSGTALNIGNRIMPHLKKTKMSYTRNKKREGKDVIDIAPARAGNIPGHHQVMFVPYTDMVDRILMMHDNFNRDAFALGAIESAGWILRKKEEAKGKDEIFSGLFAYDRDVLGV